MEIKGLAGCYGDIWLHLKARFKARPETGLKGEAFQTLLCASVKMKQGSEGGRSEVTAMSLHKRWS